MLVLEVLLGTSEELRPQRRLEGAVLQGMGGLLPPRSASFLRQVQFFEVRWRTRCRLQSPTAPKAFSA